MTITGIDGEARSNQAHMSKQLCIRRVSFVGAARGPWFLGRARANMHRWDDALAAYERAQTLHSDPGLAAEHASLLIELDRHLEAEAVVRAALATYPGDRVLRVALACVLTELQRHAEAEILLQEILREDPGNAHARHVLAMLFADTARAAQATAVAEGLCAEFPDDATAHATLGFVVLKSGRSEDALAAYEAALRIEPGRLGFTAGRATALKRLGRNSEALPLVSAIVERDSSYFDHHAWCAELMTSRTLDRELARSCEDAKEAGSASG